MSVKEVLYFFYTDKGVVLFKWHCLVTWVIAAHVLLNDLCVSHVYTDIKLHGFLSFDKVYQSTKKVVAVDDLCLGINKGEVYSS